MLNICIHILNSKPKSNIQVYKNNKFISIKIELCKILFIIFIDTIN